MKKVKTFRFSEADVGVLEALSEELGGASDADSLRAVIGDGLRHRMEHGEPPIHPHFLESMTPDGIAQAYLDYIDAVRDRIGVMRPDGRAPGHYFAQVRAGGRWEAKGLAGGWAVLEKCIRFTPDGYEQEV